MSGHNSGHHTFGEDGATSGDEHDSEEDVEDPGAPHRETSSKSLYAPPDVEMEGMSWPRSWKGSLEEVYGRSPYSRTGTPIISGFSPSFTRASSRHYKSSYSGKSVLDEAVAPLLAEAKLQEQEAKGQVGQNRSANAANAGHEAYLSRREEQKGLPPLDSREEDELAEEDVVQVEARTGSGFLQATFNGLNAGWLGLLVLLLFAGISFYTGILLRNCLEHRPGVYTYPDIGEAAFGRVGRWVIAVLLYGELYLVTVELLILEGDNLSSLYPGARVALGPLGTLSAHQAFVLLAALCVLPTVWLRDLGMLAYVSFFGVVASLVVTGGVWWVGAYGGVGFHHAGSLSHLAGLPAAVGLYGFCFSGHAVFPSIYASMKKPQHFNVVLAVAFIACTILYGGVATIGYLMYGDDIQSQITLNLPKHLVASKVAVWTTVVNPFTKYAITLNPVALALEELLPAAWNPRSWKYLAAGTLIRTLLVASGVFVALNVPFFGYVMAFIGSFLSLTISVILPCACYLRIMHGKLSKLERAACATFVVIGTVFAVTGTYSAVAGIINSY
eukprot:jgi/Mesen1/2878/ME000175S02034